MSPWAYYSAPFAGFKPTAILVLAGFLLMPQAQPAELIVESGPGQLAGVYWQSARLAFHGGQPESDWILAVAGLNLEGERDLGEMVLTCMKAPRPFTAGCLDGRLDWQLEEPELTLSASFSHQRESGVHQFALRDEHWQVELEFPEAEPDQISGKVIVDQLDLSELPTMLTEGLGLNLLYGVLSGQVSLKPDRITVQLSLAGGGFDGFEGLAAADGLHLEMGFQAAMDPLLESFSLNLAQTAGEILIGSLYLPSPLATVQLEIDGRRIDEVVALDHVAMVDPDALEVTGSGRLVQGPEGWLVEQVRIESAEIDFPLGWTRWMDGHAAAAGFGDMNSAGRVLASLDWHAERPVQLQSELFDVQIDDPRDRLTLAGVDGRIDWDQFGPAADLSWDSLKLYGLQMHRSRLEVNADASGVHLGRPLRLPLFDGAIVIDQLVWAPMDKTMPGFGLDARIEPLSLTALTRALEWPEFGGVLSGEFPGVMFVDDVLKVTGGIDIQAFSGQIQLTELAIERPFGTLPALSAQVEFSRLDLLELTGAFNFGRMEGQLSGWMRDLRLLDWRPVAMDARVFSHEDVPRRRISQRAVENLSDLGGGGSALLSETVLRVFKDFPYRRVGLACRLSNNICHIDGVARHESGGFYIVEGRALPRLDIVGHRRLVDWPQLMRQLEAMVE